MVRKASTCPALFLIHPVQSSSRAPPTNACPPPPPPRRPNTSPHFPAPQPYRYQSAGRCGCAKLVLGVCSARQLLKPQLRWVPEGSEQALQGLCRDAEDQRSETVLQLAGRPAGRGGRRGSEPSRPSAPEPSFAATPSDSRSRAEGGVFPEPDCRENTGDPYSWSSESTARGRELEKLAGAGGGGNIRGVGQPRRQQGVRGQQRPQRGRSPRFRAGRGEAERKEPVEHAAGARGWGARRAGHSPGEPGGWSRSCGPSRHRPGV